MENPELDTQLHRCLTRREKGTRIASLPLLTALCLKQPREPGAAPATSTRCCLTLCFVSTRIPGPFSTKLLSRHSATACTRAWHYSSPAAGLGIPLCSSASCQPISPASSGLYEWQHHPLGSQTFPSFAAPALTPLCPVILGITADPEQHQPHCPPLWHHCH